MLSGHAAAHRAADAPGALRDGAPFGTVSVSSQPWGQLYIDGHATGVTTPVVDYRLPVGTHRVRVEDDTSGRMTSVEVEVLEGEVARLSLRLREVTAEERERLMGLERAVQGADAGPR